MNLNPFRHDKTSIIAGKALDDAPEREGLNWYWQNVRDNGLSARSEATFKEIEKLPDPAARIAGYDKLKEELEDRLKPRTLKRPHPSSEVFESYEAFQDAGMGAVFGGIIGWGPAAFIGAAAASLGTFFVAWAAAIPVAAAGLFAVGAIHDGQLWLKKQPHFEDKHGNSYTYYGAKKLIKKIEKNYKHDQKLVASQKVEFKSQSDGASTFDANAKLTAAANNNFKKAAPAPAANAPANKPAAQPQNRL